MIKYITVLASFFWSSFVFSQSLPRTIILGKDTCMVFSAQQSKQLIFWDLERLECREIQRNSEIIIDEMDSLIILKDKELQEHEAKDKIYESTISDYKELQTIHGLQIQSLNKKNRGLKKKGIKNVFMSIIITFTTTYFLVK